MLGLGLGIIEACVWLLDSGTPAVIGPGTGDGTMDFSIATGDDTGLLALLEDI